jgi:hypothetical protein
MDSAYYAAAVIVAIRRNGARFSVTAPASAAIRAAITTIPEDAWQPIEYPQAVWMTSWAAWLAIAAITHNLVRAAGALAGRRHARARAATIRGDLIAVAARTARHGRGRLTIHLPEGWHREHEWLNLWEAACGPPAAAA